jgi:RHS repeat-associated protein
VCGSSYGYAGEWTDASGLQYLRARYDAPQQGRFVTRDPFPGILTEPASLTPYTYALNNPVMYTDPSGETPLLLLGVLGGLLGGTAYGYGSQVIRNFSQGICFWNAFSYNIDAGQIALFAGVGTVMGLGMGGAMVGIQALAGYLTAGGTIGAVILQGYGNLSQAARYTIQQANQLRIAISGTGLQVHHIIEQRFASALGQSAKQARQWLSVAVTPEEHQVFTNAWRSAIGYINTGNPMNTGTVTSEYIWLVAQDIYSKYPALLEAANQTIFGH